MDKQERTFITINAVQLAAELAEAALESVFSKEYPTLHMWRTAEKGVSVLTDKAQDLFNSLNDSYTAAIENARVPQA